MIIKETTPMDFDTWFKIAERLETALKSLIETMEGEGLERCSSCVEAKKLLEELN